MRRDVIWVWYVAIWAWYTSDVSEVNTWPHTNVCDVRSMLLTWYGCDMALCHMKVMWCELGGMTCYMAVMWRELGGMTCDMAVMWRELGGMWTWYGMMSYENESYENDVTWCWCHMVWCAWYGHSMIRLWYDTKVMWRNIGLVCVWYTCGVPDTDVMWCVRLWYDTNVMWLEVGVTGIDVIWLWCECNVVRTLVESFPFLALLDCQQSWMESQFVRRLSSVVRPPCRNYLWT